MISSTFYSQKFVRCMYNYNTGINRHCKYQDFESEMIDTEFGKVCHPCSHVIEIGKKRTEKVLAKLITY